MSKIYLKNIKNIPTVTRLTQALRTATEIRVDSSKLKASVRKDGGS